MDRNNLPANIRSIILAIDDELQHEFITKNTNEFISSIDAIIGYYYPILYERVYKQQINIDYKPKLNDFIYTLTTGIYQRLEMIKNHPDTDNDFFTRDYLYEEIIELVAQYLLNIYYDFIEDYAETHHLPIWVFTDNNISRLVNNAKTFKAARQHLNIFADSVYVIDAFMDRVKIDITKDISITFYHLPRAIFSRVKKCLYDLSKYQQFITPIDIYCISKKIDSESYLSCTNNQLDISQGYFDILYNIIYLLLKDKLLNVYDEQYWRDLFANILNTRYIADGLIVHSHYLFHPRAQIDHIEYFMSVIITFILDADKLQVADFRAYQQIKRILLEEFI